MLHSQTKSFNYTLLLIMKLGLEYIDTYILGSISIFLRTILRKSLSKSNIPFTMTEVPNRFDIITLKPSSYNPSNLPFTPYKNTTDLIIYIHGGGFMMCDHSDIMLSGGLLPCLRELLGTEPPPIYSFQYTLLPESKTSGTYRKAQKEVYDTYYYLISQGKHPVAIICDSAGGNLALGLILRIQKDKNITTLPSLCLISPWLNIFSYYTKEDTVNNKDYISPRGIRKCRNSYLGSSLSYELMSQYKECKESYSKPSADQFRNFLKNHDQEDLLNYFHISDCGNSDLDIEYICPNMISDQLLTSLPSIQIIGGEDELFFSDINDFGNRLLRHNQFLLSVGKQPIHEYIIGKSELHVYPLFWTTIGYVILSSWNLGWLFDMLTFYKPYHKVRRQYIERVKQSESRLHHDSQSEFKISEYLPIHSEESYETVKKIARFIASKLS